MSQVIIKPVTDAHHLFYCLEVILMNIWGDKPYNNLNYFLRNKFGEKVFKISLDAGFSCPNRDGTISSGGCIFCSERGSGDFAGNRNFSITKQFEDIKRVMNNKWKSGKYIAYFQAYTNTYASIEVLEKKYREALEQDGVVALAIATRPDCIDDSVIKLLKEISKEVYVWVELGLQTMNDKTARLTNRGYGLECFEKAVHALENADIDIVVHTIIGLPGEGKQDVLNTVDYLNKFNIAGVKFHLLHLMKETPMVKLYENGELHFLEMDEYIDILCSAIRHLRKDIVIHRLTGDAPRNSIIGPMWSLKKWEVLNAIDYTLRENRWYQGLDFSTNKL